LLAAAPALLTGCFRKKYRAVEGLAFVANEDGRAVAVVGLDPFELIRHIPVNAPPAALIAHPHKPLIYALTPANGTVHEIDAARLEVTRRVQVASSATSMRLDENGDQLWVLSGATRRLVRVGTAALRSESQIPLPAVAVDFDLSSGAGRSKQYWHDTDLAAISYGPAGGVQILHRTSGALGPMVRISGEVGQVRFRSDGRAVLVADLAGRMLSILSAPDSRVMTNLPLALRPDYFCFHPDGGQLYITGDGRDAVVVVYPHNVPQVAETILAGRAPAAMTASDRFLFITSPAGGEVIIMNIDTRRVVATAAAGAEPSFVTLTPKGEYALVLNRKSGDMAVIRVAAIAPNRQKTAALLTMIPVGSKPVSAVVIAG
jgi:DNA-binding beta-propeller fold protein YncE